MYNISTHSSTTAEKKRKNRDGEIQLTYCLSRIERSTVKPTENVVITCHVSESNYENHRSPSSTATPVLSPGIARAAVWVGRGAFVRSRGSGRRPGAAGVEKTYFNSIKLRILTIMRPLFSFRAKKSLRHQQGRGSEAIEAVFYLPAKKASSYWGAYRLPSLYLLVFLPVCLPVFLSVCMCNIRRFW